MIVFDFYVTTYVSGTFNVVRGGGVEGTCANYGRIVLPFAKKGCALTSPRGHRTGTGSEVVFAKFYNGKTNANRDMDMDVIFESICPSVFTERRK